MSFFYKSQMIIMIKNVFDTDVIKKMWCTVYIHCAYSGTVIEERLHNVQLYVW